MKLTDHIALVASGNNGLSITHARDCNAYLIDTGDGLLLIDAGVGLDNRLIETEIKRDGFDPRDIRKIIITHAHADHAVGTVGLRQSSGAKLIADEQEAKVLGDAELLTDTMAQYIEAKMYPSDYVFPAIAVDSSIRDGDVILMGNIALECLVCPGHSAGGLCLFGMIDGKRVLFSGDVVFFQGKINLLSTFDTDLLAYKQSIMRLAGLELDALLPGHLQPILNDGASHIRMAADKFSEFIIPHTLL